LIIAHRGASALAPENTIAAILRALEDGAEGLEIDVRLSADGVPVVFHDETLERIAGSGRSISDLTAVELSEIDAGSWFNRMFPKIADPAFANEKIPTFSRTLEVLQSFSGRLYVELKCNGSDARQLVRAVAARLRGTNLLPRIVLKSFTLSTIPHIREILPEARTAALFEPKIMTMIRKKRFIIDLAREVGADELSIHYSLATRSLMKNAQKNDLPVTVWTVDRPGWLTRGQKLGVAAVITNDPRQMLSHRNS
jgi:glycerophosphoryl diester phosphodiesterase